MFKALIFDMNGVLVNDETIHEAAFREALKKYGVILKHGDYMNYAFGKTDRVGIETILARYKIKNIDVSELVRQKIVHYFKNIKGNLRSFPGAIDLVKQLASRYKLALVSNASPQDVDLIMNNFNIIKYFKVIISNTDFINGKPEPEPYLKAAERLEEKPGDCLVIEDSPAGITSAKSAGMTCWAILTTYKKDKLGQADEIFENFLQIKNRIILT